MATNIAASTATNFTEMLYDNKIITMAIAAIIADRFHDISNAIFDNIIMPILNIDLDGNGIGDGKEFIDKLKKKKFIIKGRHIGVGNLSITFIKTVIIIILIYIAWKITCIKKK